MNLHVASADAALERRHRLAAAVEDLFVRFERHQEIPSRPELEALAGLCQDEFLPQEAARLHRWLGHV